MFREYRIKNNLSFKQLADLTYLEEESLKRIEYGSRKASVISAKRLIKTLNISAEDIFNYYSNLTPRSNNIINRNEITQKELSKLAKIDEDTITNIKKCYTLPSPTTLSKIINTIDITPQELYDYILNIPDDI